MHFWKWWDKYFSMRCDASTINGTWSINCASRAIFFIHQLNQKQLLSLYSLNSLKSCNINFACFTLTHRSKVFLLRKDLWAIRFIFNVIVVYECKRWICCWDFYYSQLCVQNNRITSLNSVWKVTWTTFAPFSNITSGPEHFWLWWQKSPLLDSLLS